MKRILFILFSCCSSAVMAQDIFPGTWQMEYLPNGNNSPIRMELQIASPERNILFPATLLLQCDSFSARYQLLLVKKNGRQLGISRNKFPVSESPFSLGNWTVMLNGTFDFSKDLRGTPLLTANRIAAKKYGLPMPAPESYTEGHGVTAIRLRDFLKDANIQLKKVNNDPWTDEAAQAILQPSQSPGYFGLIDTVLVQSKDAVVRFDNNKDNDIITVQLNGKNIVDQVDSKKKRPDEEILLDTGLNIISFFADDFGKSPPSGAAIHLDFVTKKRTLDFNSKPDIAANFIVAKVYYEYDKSNDTRFEAGTGYGYDPPVRINAGNSPGTKNGVDTSLQRNGKVVGNIIAHSQQITLAIWDDAVEDGDSISLSINGKWIAQGFPVKKQPQFIYVTLEPGPNTITFVADNLGSIIPNTSVLEIIDGKKRKSFYIDTDLSRNNLVKIYYDYRPDN
jgi:hypothetical protein